MESADEKSTAASRSERTALILERGAMGAAGTASRESSAAGAVTAGAVVSGAATGMASPLSPEEAAKQGRRARQARI